MADRYTPTVGMILALAGHRRATGFDIHRCRRRGLIDLLQRPTAAGHAILSRYKIVEPSHG